MVGMGGTCAAVLERQSGPLNQKQDPLAVMTSRPLVEGEGLDGGLLFLSKKLFTFSKRLVQCHKELNTKDFQKGIRFRKWRGKTT